MLRNHGIHNSDERFIACEESVSSRQKVSLQPSFAHVLGKIGVHDSAVQCQVLIFICKLGIECSLFHLKCLIEPVGLTLVRSEYSEVVIFLIEDKKIPYVSAQLHHILSFDCSR